MIATTIQASITAIKNNPKWAGLLIVALAIVLRLTFTWISLVNLPVTSDEASSVLLAKMISQGARPLLFIGQPYQFPIESYLMAPFVEMVPRTPLGARYQQLLLGFLAFMGFLAIVHTAFSQGFRWPAVLLISFPSAYFLIYLAAYAPPQYSMSLTLAWGGIYTVLQWSKHNRSAIFPLISGLCCGLAISNHLLTVTISAGIFTLIVFSGSLRRSITGILVFSASCLIGAFPYILALLLIPGAYENLPNSVTLIEALGRMINPALFETLPGAMGVNPILFPDLRGHLTWFSSLRTIFAVFYALLFFVLAGQRLWTFLTTVSRRQWPKLELVDLALITSLLSLWVFASHLASTNSYRYLLPAVWCFPFLVAHGFVSFPGRLRSFIGFATLLLAAFNIAVAAQIMVKWSDREQLEQYSFSPTIKELTATLRDKGITSCYASFWLAYRITFETDEEIICSLPYNQRFLHWPIPYKQSVERNPETAYVLTQRFRPRLPARIFEKHLRDHDIGAEKTKVGPFFIYQNFTLPGYQAGREYILDDSQLVITTNSGNEQSQEALSDGDLQTAWVSKRPQEQGQWIEAFFATERFITGITLIHHPDETLSPESFRILGLRQIDGIERWEQLADSTAFQPERLRFVNNHPVYNGISQQLRFEPVQVKGIRIEIEKPNTSDAWGMAEIEISALTP